MDEHLYIAPQNIMNPQQDMMNPQQDMMNPQQDMMNPQQQEEHDPLNTGMMMSAQEQQELQRESMTERMGKQVTAPVTSRSLERTAEVNFQEGINSRRGPCDVRNTRKKKMLVRDKMTFRKGLSEHSKELADTLYDNDQGEKQRQRDNNKFYDKWMESDSGKCIRWKSAQSGLASVEECKSEYAHLIPLLGWMKDDKSRENLLSRKCLLQSRAYEELLDRVLGFQLQPNALCTLPAVQRAGEVAKLAPLVNNLQSALGISPKEVTEQLPPYKLEQFRKFQQVFGHLQQGTEAAAHLQGVNADGKNRYGFYEGMTLGKKWDMERDYADNKKQHSKSATSYEQELAQYNAAYGDKEALHQRHLAFIKQSTGAPLSEKVYDIKRELEEVDKRLQDKVEVSEVIMGLWSPSKTEAESIAIMASADHKREFGGVLTDDEKKMMDRPAHIASRKLAHYIETEAEREALFNKNPELRAAQVEKTIDRLLKKFPNPLSDDPSVYSCANNVQASAMMTALSEDISQVNVILLSDPFSIQHIPAEKTEQMNHMLTIAIKFTTYESLSAGIMGIQTNGELSDGKINIDGDFVKLEQKQMLQLQVQQAELYKQAVQQYNEYHDNSDPQSLEKIANAKKLLGTDLGATKHTLEMAEELREPQPVEQQLMALKGVHLLDSRTNDAMAAAQVRLMDKLMEFPLDATQVSITPDMENIPKIIAHGRLVDEAKRQMAEDKAMRQQAEKRSGYHTELPIPADKLAQWEEFTEVFTTLRDTAAIAVSKVGLTVDGTSRYADKLDITPEELAADKSQLSRAYTDGHTKLELLGRGYAAKYLADEEGKQQAKEAEQLLGTSFGITKETYKLATALQGNQKQAETNAAADKQWFDAWRESEEGKRQLAGGSSFAEKKAAHASKLKELRQERLAIKKTLFDQFYLENPEPRNVTPNIDKVPAVIAIAAKLAAHGNDYVPTNEETKQMPLSAHKSAAQVLHMVEGDDKAKLFSEEPKQRAEVLTAMAEKLTADRLDEKQLTNPALVQELPALLAKEKDAKALYAVITEDTGAKQFIARVLRTVVGNYANMSRRAGQAASHILHEHGLTANGNSLYKGHEPKDVQDYRQISAEKAVHDMLLQDVSEKFEIEYRQHSEDRATLAKERLAQEKKE